MSESTKERRLRFESEGQYRTLRSALVREGYAPKSEHGAFLFASPAGDRELDVVDVAVLKPGDFATQTAYYLELHDTALQEMIVRAHRTNTALIEAHSHPFTEGPRVCFSPFDCEGLADVGPQVSWRLPGGLTSPWSLAGMRSILSTGRVESGGLEAPWILSLPGSCYVRVVNLSAPGGKTMDRFDRQRKIFGDEGQKRLRATTVGVVGGGGLGSFMVLELAYLGIGKIVIVDHDQLKDSNRNRLVGAWMSHANGTPKVQILRELGVLIYPEIEIEVMQVSIEKPEAEDALAGVDVVVGCVDHDGPRFVLNEICCKHGLPLIDAASDTMPEKDKVVFGGRVCVATPATGCLVCLEVLDQNELQEYYASPEQRADRNAIYGVPERALAGGGPSVITVNGVVASIAATELMVLVTQLRAPIAHQDWRGYAGRLHRVVDHKEGCYYCGLRPVAQT